MPIYVYECPKCGEFELEQRITDQALTQCGYCDSPVKRIITRVGFVIPAYMRAPGSVGSSAASCDNQARYLASDQHKADRAQSERIYDRTEAAKDDLQKHLRQELAPEKAKDKIERRKAERKAQGLPL